MAWNTQTLTAWEKKHGIEMQREPLAIFERYLRNGFTIFSALVRHPPVPEPKLYVACSVILQRGVIVYANGIEDLHLRSYFHSARDAENFVNFVPSGALRVSFKSDKIWFPLELTQVIQEPYSYVVLDVLTTKPLKLEQLPKPFQAGKQGTVTLGKQQYQAVRLTAKLAAKQTSPDLNIRAQ